MVTVQVQETIQKQRILEAVEYEILNNTLMATNTMKYNNEDIKKKIGPDFFHPFIKYSNDLWTQSTEPLQYIAQLDPQIQADIVIYYTNTVKRFNNLVEKYENLANEKLKNCHDFSILSEKEKVECNSWSETILSWEADTASDISDVGFKILENFHPTEDRLNSPLLKFFMGDKSVRILSGE